MSELPNHAYYQACVGAWRTPIGIEVTDASALTASAMSLANRWSVRVMAVWPRWLGGFVMETTVAYDAKGSVAHTTVVRWLGLALMRSQETIALDPDGQAFTMTGTQRVMPAVWKALPLSGHGSVGAEGRTASYELQWLGVTIRQTTALVDGVVTVRQEGPGFLGLQRLERRSV